MNTPKQTDLENFLKYHRTGFYNKSIRILLKNIPTDNLLLAYYQTVYLKHKFIKPSHQNEEINLANDLVRRLNKIKIKSPFEKYVFSILVLDYRLFDFNIENAKKLMFEAARNGVMNAQASLAQYFLKGYHTVFQKNSKKALFWYLKAAKAGYLAAQINLAIEYSKGIITTKNNRLAMYWHTKAALSGHLTAMFNLGRIYEKGELTRKNLKKAIYWYEIAANLGDASAQNNLGLAYDFGKYVKKDLKKAFYWYKKGALNNLQSSQCNLAIAYEKGYGVKVDYKKALYWYKKSADNGYSMAQFNLGYIYSKGDITKQDLSLALNYYELAAKGGHLGAQNNLAIMYESGQGVAKDPQLAIYWYKKASDSGSNYAQKNLALAYEKGTVTEKNPHLAIEWYIKSSDNGNLSSLINLGEIYEEGKLVDKDYKKALYYYRKAAKHNLAEATYKLSVLYSTNTTVKKNGYLANYWLNKAAMQQHPTALWMLGKQLLESTAGKSLDAVQHLSKACDLKNKDACFALGQFYQTGYQLKVDLEKAYNYHQKANEYGFNNDSILELLSWDLNKHKPDNSFSDYGLGLSKYTNDFKLYKKINDDLKNEFSKTWDYLHIDTKLFLANSLYLYGNIKKINRRYTMDYSPVILSLTKALEKELYHYLYKLYIDFIEKNKLNPDSFKREEKSIFFDQYNKLISYNDMNENNRITLGSFTRIMDAYVKLNSSEKLDFNKILNPRASEIVGVTNSSNENPALNKASIHNQGLIEEIVFTENFMKFAHHLFDENAFNKNNFNHELVAFLFSFKEKLITLNSSFRIRAAHRNALTDSDANFCANVIIKKHKLLHNFLLKIKPEHLPKNAITQFNA
jgi:TPR repeat protein